MSSLSILETLRLTDEDSRPITFKNIRDLDNDKEFRIDEFRLIQTRAYGARLAIFIGKQLIR